MDNEKSSVVIDSQELLFRFISSCQRLVQSNELKYSLLSCADIVSAAYFFRKHPNPDDFISAYLKDNQDYFKLQWIRATWTNLSRLTEEELSNLVINQIMLVANSQEDN